MFVYYNPNPLNKQTSGDCTVRAISKALGWDWEKTYTALCVQGLQMAEMPSANSVWGTFLLDRGYSEYSLMRRCRDCYDLADFCKDHPRGEYLVGTGDHIVFIKDGNHYDSWDSATITPTYYYTKEKEETVNE